MHDRAHNVEIVTRIIVQELWAGCEDGMYTFTDHI